MKITNRKSDFCQQKVKLLKTERAHSYYHISPKKLHTKKTVFFYFYEDTQLHQNWKGARARSKKKKTTFMMVKQTKKEVFSFNFFAKK